MEEDIRIIIELDLKTREYKFLCEKLEQVKKKKIDPNDERLLWLKELFLINHDEIVEINKKLEQLKIEVNQSNANDLKLFKNKDKTVMTANSNKMIIIKDGFITKIISKIKKDILKLRG